MYLKIRDGERSGPKYSSNTSRSFCFVGKLGRERGRLAHCNAGTLSELWTLTDATKFDEIMTSRQISFFRTFHQVVLKFITTDFFL